ncbi:MAG TPA: hypothetical protein VGQ36_06470 [Thermoanaerobaculia bacterium]|jgi:hypothetical protein|nr:hypothetical protein [Thermoanaerobaculia bacterium]
MPFPEHIERVLTAYKLPADTKSALYDLYLSMGDEVLEVFADLADGVTSATTLTPDDTLLIRERVVERYLRRNHPRWLEGKPTASLWHPRAAEGRASGAAIPMGKFPELAHQVSDQPLPDGMLLLGRNAHYGGRAETISFDVVARDLEDAVAIGKASGQQHTIPGSVGATSGTFDSALNVALLWEVQPNVFKPAGERNRAIAKIFRRHRNWHLITLAAALEWLGAQKAEIFILRGGALATTHEVNPAKPVSETIAALHDRTVEQVARAADATLAEPTNADELALLDSCVMNHALRKHVLVNGAAAAMWKFMIPGS